MLLGILLSIVAAGAQIGGGMLALQVKRFPHAWERTLLALGAGFLLALVFVDLIPESFRLTANPDQSVIAMLVGFSVLHFFEHTLVTHFHFGEETHVHHGISHSSAFGAVGGLTLHAFFDGMAIAAVSTAKPAMGFLISVAVLLHKIPEGLTVASVMVAGKRSTKEAMNAGYILGLSTILGALVVFFFVTIDETLIGFLFAFSAGAALYVGACDLIPEINKTRGRKAPILVFLGMMFFYLGKLALERFGM
ncbi:MAG: ZIP family metal transporter [Ignavibacteriota bacterium]